MCNKEICKHPWVLEGDCFLCKNILRKHFVQVELIDKMGGKRTFSLGYLVYNMRLRAGSTSVKIAMLGRGWVYGEHVHHMQRHRLHNFFLPCEMSSSMALTLFAIELTNGMFFQ